MLDTRRLRIFCTVAELGSFTAAAARLHLTQSAISQQMAILEREVGTALVERRPRGIRLTAAGRLLAERARLLLGELAGLERSSSQTQGVRRRNSAIRSSTAAGENISSTTSAAVPMTAAEGPSSLVTTRRLRVARGRDR